jgi:hypothetical protein
VANGTEGFLSLGSGFSVASFTGMVARGSGVDVVGLSAGGCALVVVSAA